MEWHAAQHAEAGVEVVVVGVAAAQVAGRRRCERVAAVEHPPVVEADEVAGPERVADLEARVAGDVGEDPQRLVGARDVGGRHVGRAANRVERAQGERLVSVTRDR